MIHITSAQPIIYSWSTEPHQPSEMLEISVPRGRNLDNICEIELASFHITRKTISVDLDGLLDATADFGVLIYPTLPCVCDLCGATMGSDDFCHPLAFVKDKTAHHGGLTICQPSC